MNLTELVVRSISHRLWKFNLGKTFSKYEVVPDWAYTRINEVSELCVNKLIDRIDNL